MGKLLYVTNVSLDGFIEDEHGNFDFTVPSDDVFAFITDLIRPAGTYLYGRRLYETMAPWETEPALAAESELRGEFARAWQAADKVVYSTTLASAPTTKTTIKPRFEPAAARELKSSASADLTVGGAELAAQAFDAGLVDEIHLFVAAVHLGAGKPALPRGKRIELELLDERRFSNGTIYVRYAVSPLSKL